MVQLEQRIEKELVAERTWYIRDVSKPHYDCTLNGLSL